MNSKQEKYLRSDQPGQNLRKAISTTVKPPRLPATGELPSAATARRDPTQSDQHNSGVPIKETERIEFEKFPNSTTFMISKTNCKSEVCSSSSFPTEVMVQINETDSARNMDELRSTSSISGRKIPDFDVLDSNITSALS